MFFLDAYYSALAAVEMPTTGPCRVFFIKDILMFFEIFPINLLCATRQIRSELALRKAGVAPQK